MWLSSNSLKFLSWQVHNAYRHINKDRTNKAYYQVYINLLGHLYVLYRTYTSIQNVCAMNLIICMYVCEITQGKFSLYNVWKIDGLH